MERKIDDMVAELRRRHPWLDIETAKRIADDDVKAEMEMEDDDPFPEDRDEQDERRPRRRRGPGEWADRNGKPGAVAIVFGKPANDDPFPED